MGIVNAIIAALEASVAAEAVKAAAAPLSPAQREAFAGALLIAQHGVDVDGIEYFAAVSWPAGTRHDTRAAVARTLGDAVVAPREDAAGDFGGYEWGAVAQVIIRNRR